MERPTCKTCPYYDAEAMTLHYPPNRGNPMIMIAPKNVQGICKLTPLGTHKTPEDWCGEHPDFPAYIASLIPQPEFPDKAQTKIIAKGPRPDSRQVEREFQESLAKQHESTMRDSIARAIEGR